MRSFILPIAALAASAVAQIPTEATQTYADKTGTRSLFLPFITQDAIVASILGNNTANETTYVLGCAKTASSCFSYLSPNLTFTEGPTALAYVVTNTAGVATIDCTLNGTTSAECHQVASGTGGGNIQKQSTTFAPSDIKFQAVDVTSTANNTATLPQTVTITAASSTSSTSSTSSSTAGVAHATGNGPWAMGGAAGAALVALAAL